MSEWPATRGGFVEFRPAAEVGLDRVGQFDHQTFDAHMQDKPHHVIDADKGHKRLAKADSLGFLQVDERIGRLEGIAWDLWPRVQSHAATG